ncbi:MAG: hypothetical protein U9N52_01485 [Campylobacterota bacterium]|nr:hypothetical protein [Campylobacterota bacterium]
MRIVILFLLPLLLSASEKDLALELNLFPGTKAKIQWKRIFSNEKKLQKYHLHTLSLSDRKSLENYLVKYAADSAQPIVPGL